MLVLLVSNIVSFGLLPDVSLRSVSAAGWTLTGEERLAGVLSVTGVQC